LGLLSALVVILHVIFLTTPLKNYFVPNSSSSSTSRNVFYAPDPNPPTGFLAELKANIKSNAGFTIWAYKALRLIGCLALVSFSIVAAIVASDDTLHTNDNDDAFHIQGKHWGKKHRGRKSHHKNSEFTEYAWIQVALAIFYVRICLFLSETLCRRESVRPLGVLTLSAFGII